MTTTPVAESDEMTDEESRQQQFPGTEEDEDLDITQEDLAALEQVATGFIGFRCRKKMAPQSSQWDDDMKAAALEAIGGGETDSVSMTDKLFPAVVAKEVPAVRAMSEAQSAVNRLCTDRYYTLPHPEPGVRLVKKGKDEMLREKITAATTAVATAAQQMNDSREHIKTVMRKEFSGRFKKHEKVYDLDFTLLFRVDFKFVNLEVPSYLQHSEKLYAEALATAKSEAKEVIQLETEAMAKTLFDVIDHLVERLESRRMLDQTHEIVDVEVHGDQHIVTYVTKGAKMTRANELVMELTAEQFEERVADSNKRKTFTNVTAKKIFDEMEYAEHQLGQTGIGGGELAAVFTRLKKTVGGQDKDTFASSLRRSEAYREGMVNNLSRIGNAVLGLSVIKGKRDLIRSKASSRKLNPEKA